LISLGLLMVYELASAPNLYLSNKVVNYRLQMDCRLTR